VTRLDDDEHASTGTVQARVAAEFPGLRLRFSVVPGRAGRTPAVLRDRLRALSDRYLGSRVVTLRTQPITRAYRSFFRQIGLDPDVTRVPIEAAAVQRLAYGGFPSRDCVHDALLIALVETGVAVWALDATAVDSTTLGIRLTSDGDVLGSGRQAEALLAGRLVVADARAVHALLFGPVVEAHLPGERTREVVLFAVGVGGVPQLAVEEALWLAGELLSEGV
jgi:DNA/RNA-binding domain of Phe-tRNA-synthetase-like protein